MYTYNTKNTCSKVITFELLDGHIHDVKFLGGGCPGNLQAVPRLVEGLTPEEVIKRLEGINCGIRGTSCANELVNAIKTNLNIE